MPALPLPQEERDASLDSFKEKFGAAGEVRRDDLTIMASKVVRCRRRWVTPLRMRMLLFCAVVTVACWCRCLLPPPLVLGWLLRGGALLAAARRRRDGRWAWFPLPHLSPLPCHLPQDDPTEQIFVFFPDEVKVGACCWR